MIPPLDTSVGVLPLAGPLSPASFPSHLVSLPCFCTSINADQTTWHGVAVTLWPLFPIFLSVPGLVVIEGVPKYIKYVPLLCMFGLSSELVVCVGCYLCVLCLSRDFVRYGRVAMKLMYGNVLGSRTTTSAPVIRLLQHMSAKQGAAMDAPGSVKKIPV